MNVGANAPVVSDTKASSGGMWARMQGSMGIHGPLADHSRHYRKYASYCILATTPARSPAISPIISSEFLLHLAEIG